MLKDHSQRFNKKTTPRALMKQAGEMVITKVPVETGCLIENSWVKG